MTRKKELPPLPYELEEVIFGGLLGDFNLQSRTNGKTWRLRLAASNKHVDYITHLQELFSPWLGSLMQKRIVVHKVQQKSYKTWYINTLVFDELNQFGLYFYILIPREGFKYPIHKKILPSKEILYAKLTPRAIAYWLMDDGSFNGHTVRFFTNGFTLEEVNLLREILLSKYNIKTTLQFSRLNHPTIYVLRSSFVKLKELVWDYVIPWFRYKLGSGLAPK
jgi:LAGLIDADG DNA endonuclease family